MPATTMLRTLVATEIVLLAASVLTAFLPGETPPAVDEYLNGPGAGPLSRLIDADPTALTYVLVALFVVVVALYVASLVGLILLKPWSRRLYVLLFVVGVCAYPFLGTSLVDPISGVLNYLDAACAGAIVATLFSNDVKALFDIRTPGKSLEHTRAGSCAEQ